MKTRMKSTEWFAHPPGESSDVGSLKRKSKIMDEHLESHNRLHMLAAVASHHLHSDPTMKMSAGNNVPKVEASMRFIDIHSPAENGHHLSNKRKRASCRKLGEGDMLSLDQIRELSAHHLLKCFSDFDGNELKRTFTYSCVLDPARCQKKFSSFGSELKARQQMKSHLLEHVSKLSEEAMMGLHFKAETVQSRQRRKVDSANLLNKKKKAALRAMGQPLKTTYNMKDDSKPKGGIASSSQVLCMDPATRDVKSESKLGHGGAPRLAGIFREHPTKVDKGLVKQEVDVIPNSTIVMDVASIKIEGGGGTREVLVKVEDPAALMDHNYVLQGTDSTSGDDMKGQGLLGGKSQEWHCDGNESLLKRAIKTGLEEKSKCTSAELNKFMVSETLHNMIMVCVLEEEKLQLKQLPCVGSEMDVKTGQPKDFLKKVAESESEEDLREIKVMSHNNNIERDEYRMKKKPKGKAKFIGQSKAEKEMAIQLIEAIKGRVTTLESLECQICNPPRSFTAPTTLISHYRSHAGIKPYECRLCRSVFTRQHSLNYHMLIHSNQTRFTCSDCGRKFRHPSHFKEHRRRHTGESPYECSDCMYRFKTRNTYKRHMRTHHGKMLTPSGELLVLSDDEFKQVRALPRHVSGKTTARILSKSRNGDCTRSNAMQRGERSNGEDDEMEYISQESDVSSDVNSDSNSPDELCGEAEEERGSNKENNNVEVDGAGSGRQPLEGKAAGGRKAFFKDIVKEAMRQSDIPFQGSDFRSCEDENIIPDPIEFSVTEVVGHCDNSYFDELSMRTEDGDQVTEMEGMNSTEKGMCPIVVKSELLDKSSSEQLNCIYLNTDQCMTLDSQNVEVMCGAPYTNPSAGASKMEGLEGATSIEKGKPTMLLFKPMVVSQGSQVGLGTATQPKSHMASTSGSFVSHPSMSILACQPVNGLLGDGEPKEGPAGKKIYIQAEGTLIGALKSQTLMLLNEDAGAQVSYCPVGSHGGALKNGMFPEEPTTHL